ncbi:MAG: hypothetical protein O7E57_16455, partial [Gammaproteobacteria bacterium]|nr:hypothetical protein [Gammaproteobacteria bacterium]
PLANFSGTYQCSLVEEILKDARIPLVTQYSSGFAIAFGLQSTEGDLGDQVFMVPEDRLQEAKDILCANGVLCDISERLLRRCLTDIVEPLLKNQKQDFDRLIRFVAVNNKETVRAVFQFTIAEEGGEKLLVDLFFMMAQEGSPGLKKLARVLNATMDDDFGKRFLSEANGGAKTTRLSLLDIIPDLPVTSWRIESLAAALRDEDEEIRDAGSEALFAMAGVDYGYEPDAAPDRREAAVQQMLRESGFH